MAAEEKTRRGLFIVFEGIDGAGKATQADMLSRSWKKAGRGAVSLMKFPCYQETFFGTMVKRYLQGAFGPLGSNHPALVSLLYALDRWTMKPILEQHLESCSLVVCDRYVASNLAHQGGQRVDEARRALMRMICHVEYDVFGLPRPDLTILLDIEPEKAAERLKKEGNRDIHEEDVEHLRRARRAYWDLVAGSCRMLDSGYRSLPDEVQTGPWFHFGTHTSEGVVRAKEALAHDIWECVDLLYRARET